MNRILISAIIATGFHMALMVHLPFLLDKNNNVLPPKIKPVMVTISYRQPRFKKKIFDPHKPQKKETRSAHEIKIKPKPPETISSALKTNTRIIRKNSTIYKKKKVNKPQKKSKQDKPVMPSQKKVKKKKINPAGGGQAKPIKSSKKQNFKGQPAPSKKTIPQNEGIFKQKETRIEITKPLYKENTMPSYPLVAQKRGYHGVVELMVLVSAKGTVFSLKIFKSSGYKSLDRQAMKTVKNWHFEPGKKNGHPQEMWVKIPVKFELN